MKREAEEIERDSSAEFTLLNTVTHRQTPSLFSLSHTQSVLIRCHVAELTAVLLLVNVTFKGVRNSVSEGGEGGYLC